LDIAPGDIPRNNYPLQEICKLTLTRTPHAIPLDGGDLRGCKISSGNITVHPCVDSRYIYIHLYSPMNGRKNAKQYKNNAVTLTILKYSATVIEHI